MKKIIIYYVSLNETTIFLFYDFMVLCSASFEVHYFSSNFIMTSFDIHSKTKKTSLTMKTIFFK